VQDATNRGEVDEITLDSWRRRDPRPGSKSPTLDPGMGINTIQHATRTHEVDGTVHNGWRSLDGLVHREPPS